MSRRRFPLPSPAMAVALCALFVALGGASYALTIPRNCDGTTMLRAAEHRPQVGREPRQSDESRCVSHQSGAKAFRTPLCNSLRPEQASWVT
jgi:hypothetical protein